MPEDISNLVTPVSPETQVSPVAENTPPAENADTADTADLPDEVLQIPAIQGLMAGTPAAVSANIKGAEKTEQGKAIIDNAKELQGAGIGFYRSLSGDTAVLFNTLHVSPEDIKAADKAGKLLEIAPPFDVVNKEVGMAGPGTHPSLNSKGVPGGLASPQGALPPQTAQMPMPAGNNATADRLRAQIANVKPTPPTAGARPGAGRLLNSILKPVL
jgi:hypothetical protein